MNDQKFEEIVRNVILNKYQKNEPSVETKIEDIKLTMDIRSDLGFNDLDIGCVIEEMELIIRMEDEKFDVYISSDDGDKILANDSMTIANLIDLLKKAFFPKISNSLKKKSNTDSTILEEMNQYEVKATICLMCSTIIDAKNEEKAREEVIGLLENGANYDIEGFSNIMVTNVEIEDVNEE